MAACNLSSFVGVTGLDHHLDVVRIVAFAWLSLAISEYISGAKAAGLHRPLPAEIDDTRLEQRLFPSEPPTRNRPQPDFNYMHAELKKGVTLRQLWSEYREAHHNVIILRAIFC